MGLAALVEGSDVVSTRVAQLVDNIRDLNSPQSAAAAEELCGLLWPEGDREVADCEVANCLLKHLRILMDILSLRIEAPTLDDVDVQRNMLATIAELLGGALRYADDAIAKPGFDQIMASVAQGGLGMVLYAPLILGRTMNYSGREDEKSPMDDSAAEIWRERIVVPLAKSTSEQVPSMEESLLCQVRLGALLYANVDFLEAHRTSLLGLHMKYISGKYVQSVRLVAAIGLFFMTKKFTLRSRAVAVLAQCLRADAKVLNNILHPLTVIALGGVASDEHLPE